MSCFHPSKSFKCLTYISSKRLRDYFKTDYKSIMFINGQKILKHLSERLVNNLLRLQNEIFLTSDVQKMKII